MNCGQPKLLLLVSIIQVGLLLSHSSLKGSFLPKISQINYNLLTPISSPFCLTSFLRPDNLKKKLTVCTANIYICSTTEKLLGL